MSQVSAKSSENEEMSDASTVSGASSLLHELWPNGKVGERIRDAALALRWSHSRTRDLWYAQAKRIDGAETKRLEKIRENKAAQRSQEVRRVADDHDELTARLARMEAMLAALIAAQAGNSAARP